MIESVIIGTKVHTRIIIVLYFYMNIYERYVYYIM